MMKLDDRTLTVLKNFSTINQGILVRPGNVLTTIPPERKMYARAKLTQKFDQGFAIYELSRLFGAMSMLAHPIVEFHPDHMVLREATSGKIQIKYGFVEPENVMAPPEKEPNFPVAVVSFKLPKETFQRWMKTAKALGAYEVAIVGQDGNITLETFDSRRKELEHEVREVVGKTDKDFRIVMGAEFVSKLLVQDYEVGVSKTPHFVAKGLGLEYWVATEAGSEMPRVEPGSMPPT